MHIPRMLLISLLTGVLAVSGSQPSGVGTARADETAPYRPGVVVVQLALGTRATIEQVNATYRTEVSAILDPELRAYLLELPEGETVEGMLHRMELDRRLALSEPDFIAEVPEARSHTTYAWGEFDPGPYLDGYAGAMLGLGSAELVARGSGSLVAVADTGIQSTHPALRTAIAPGGHDFVDGDPSPDDAGNGLDDDGDGAVDEATGHGTHVAGLVHLVAPEAAILPLRVLDSDGRGAVSAVAMAIRHAQARGADIINLSLGTESESQLLRNVIRAATLKGLVVVAAGGNNGANQREYPAAGSCVVAVTSVGPSGHKSDFATFGGWISLAAPGESVSSTFPPDGYATGSGTSIAAALVTGQAALLRSLLPTADARQIQGFMVGTADSLDGINPEYRGLLGAGLPDLPASVVAASSPSFAADGKLLMAGSCVG